MPHDERDEYIHNYRDPAGCMFWVAWLAWAAATFFAFIVGDTLGKSVEAMLAPETVGLPRALSIAQAVDAGASLNLFAAVSGGLVAGVVLAVGQGLVLLPFMKRAGVLEWALATIAGRAAGWTAIYVVSKQMVGLVLDKDGYGFLFLVLLLVGTALIAGLAVGYAQSIVLYRRVQYPGRWLAANLYGPIMAGLLIAAILFVEGENVLRDLNTGFAAAITAISTAIALKDVFSMSTSRAEWLQNVRWRKERTNAPQADTVLGSTLYGPSKPSQS